MSVEQHEAGFIRSFISVVGTVLLLMLLALAVAVAGVPAITQGAALTVLSGSMEPTFSPGDQIIVSGVKDPATDLVVGDIVTFLPYPDDPTLITHRIIGKGVSSDGQVSFTTRGDANSADDDPIDPKQIRGKYLYHIPYLGHLTNRVGGSGRLVVVIAAIVLLAYAAFALIKPRPKGAKTKDNHDLAEAASSGADLSSPGQSPAVPGAGSGPKVQPVQAAPDRTPASTGTSGRPSRRGGKAGPEPVISAEQLLARGSAVLQQRWQAARQAEDEDDTDLPAQQQTTIDQGVRS